MKIPSPNQGQPYNLIKDGKGYYGEVRQIKRVVYKPTNPDNPHSGVRAEEVIEKIPVNAEGVDLESGTSDSEYWQPEVVTKSFDCNHDFEITNIGIREIECRLCHYNTSFHAGRNFFEDKDGPKVKIQGQLYSIS